MLIVLPLKTSGRYNIAPPLQTWLDATHPYYHSSQCLHDLKRLASLRNCLTEAFGMPYSGHAAALSDRAMEDSLEYHACLLECERRGFLVQEDKNIGAEELHLTWTCAFIDEDTLTLSRSNLRYERVCILWNICALESFLATQENMRSKEGRIAAGRRYGTAAHILRHVRQDLMQTESMPSADLCPEVLELCEVIMLAQGQMCGAYETALARPEGPIHSILAKLATGAAELYGEALQLSQENVVKGRLPKTSKGWGAHLKAMTMLFRARAQFHEGLACHSKSKFGEEISRLNLVEKMCKDVVRFHTETVVNVVRGLEESNGSGGGDLNQEVEALVRTVKQWRGQLEKDNLEIYHEDVPEFGDLKAIAGHNMMANLPPLPAALYPDFLARPFFALLPSTK